jgi:hypothetical protein
MESPPPDETSKVTSPPPPASKGPNMMLMGAAVIIVIVLVVAALGVLAITNEGSATSNVTSTPQEMSYRLSDFPAGWQAGSTQEMSPPERPNTGYYVCSFNNSLSSAGLFDPFADVTSQIITYASTEDAKQVFTEMRGNITSINVTEVSVFDQCVMYHLDLGSLVNAKVYVFQDRNVCGILVFGSYFGYNMTSEWVDQMLVLQESRIT